jgi:hypothetical protein
MMLACFSGVFVTRRLRVGPSRNRLVMTVRGFDFRRRQHFS